jgi:RNA polymerase sigma-70 factor (ECF subfamily)
MNHAQPEPGDEAARLAIFTQHRGLLFSIAYRMLGSVADAEDMLQEAYLRWRGASTDEIRAPKAFLATIVTRLCINQLQSARVQREQYVGQWLPEPIVTESDEDMLGVERLDDSLSMALLLLLERLTPVERAVFLLHEVFGFKYGEISKSLGQSEANCRQILHRAHDHVGSMRRRFDVSSQAHRNLLERFVSAARDGDVNALLALLADDVMLHIDGGGKGAVVNIIQGSDKVARGLMGGSKALPSGMVFRLTTINGDPGLISYLDGKAWSVLILDVREERVANVYIVNRPEKLAHLPPLESAP